MHEKSNKFFLWFGRQIDRSFMEFYEKDPFGAGLYVGVVMGTTFMAFGMFFYLMIISN